MLKLYNIPQQLSVRRDLGMFLFGQIVSINLICFLITWTKMTLLIKIQFTMEVATDTLEFLDLKLKFDKKAGKVKKQFSDIKNLTREEAKKPELQKTTFSTSCNLITQYNSLLPNLMVFCGKISNSCRLPYITDKWHLMIALSVKRNKNVTEILSPLLSHRTTKQNTL